MRHKGKFVVCLLISCAFSCGFGWRVMPKIWSYIRPYFLSEQVGAQEESNEYVPYSSADLTDSFSATDSVIYYFYKETCAFCEQLEPFLKGIPESVVLADGTISEVQLVAINKNEYEAEYVISYYEEYGIEDGRRYVPAVVIGNSYLFTASEIYSGLYEHLLAGAGLETPLLCKNTRTE